MGGRIALTILAVLLVFFIMSALAGLHCLENC